MLPETQREGLGIFFVSKLLILSESLDPKLELSAPKMCFCFAVLSRKLFLDAQFPSRTTLKRDSVPLLSLSKPHGTSLWPIWRPPILMASLTGCEAGWGWDGSPAQSPPFAQICQLVPRKTTAGLVSSLSSGLCLHLGTGRTFCQQSPHAPLPPSPPQGCFLIAS